MLSDVSRNSSARRVHEGEFLPKNTSNATLRWVGDGGGRSEIPAYIAAPRLQFPPVQCMPVRKYSPQGAGKSILSEQGLTIPVQDTRAHGQTSTPNLPPALRQRSVVSSISNYKPSTSETPFRGYRYSSEWWEFLSDTTSVSQTGLSRVRGCFAVDIGAEELVLLEMMEENGPNVELLGIYLREPPRTSFYRLSTQLLSSLWSSMYESGAPGDFLAAQYRNGM